VEEQAPPPSLVGRLAPAPSPAADRLAPPPSPPARLAPTPIPPPALAPKIFPQAVFLLPKARLGIVALCNLTTPNLLSYLAKVSDRLALTVVKY
jgi:hypothetical protein